MYLNSSDYTECCCFIFVGIFVILFFVQKKITRGMCKSFSGKVWNGWKQNSRQNIQIVKLTLQMILCMYACTFAYWVGEHEKVFVSICSFVLWKNRKNLDNLLFSRQTHSSLFIAHFSLCDSAILRYSERQPPVDSARKSDMEFQRQVSIVCLQKWLNFCILSIETLYTICCSQTQKHLYSFSPTRTRTRTPKWTSTHVCISIIVAKYNFIQQQN